MSELEIIDNKEDELENFEENEDDVIIVNNIDNIEEQESNVENKNEDDEEDSNSEQDIESTFDDFNYDEEDSFLLDSDDSSLEEDEEEEEDEEDEEDDLDNAEFNFEDVKDSIEYIHEKYNFFKKEDNESCSIYLLYIEKNNAIENVEKLDFELENNKIDKEKIVNLLQEKRIYNDNKYFIKNIWKYGFNLEYNELINMFDDDEKYDKIEEMLQPINKLSNIEFEPSINVFKDKNSLFVLYSCEKPERKNKRKSMKKYVNKEENKRRTHKNK